MPIDYLPGTAVVIPVSGETHEALAEAGVDWFTAESGETAHLTSVFVPNVGFDLARQPLEMVPQGWIATESGMKGDMINEIGLGHAPREILVKDFRASVEKGVKGFEIAGI